VLREIDNATKAFPNAYIRMCAFDANRQVQVASMLVHRPSSAKEWKPVNQRQVGALAGWMVAGLAVSRFALQD
jgi:ribulose-bisphosphate carboxylase small chain